MDDLLASKVIVTIDKGGEAYKMDFNGKILDIYSVLKTITTDMESGEFFKNNLNFADENGDPLAGTKLRRTIDAIRTIKEEIESEGNSGEQGSLHNLC